jgi:transcriptional regulator with XRE-family HTH domain
MKAHRIAQNMSLQEVADLIGTSKSYVWELEDGRCKNPSLSMVKKIANMFGYTVSAFIGETETIVNNGEKIRELTKEIMKLTY